MNEQFDTCNDNDESQINYTEWKKSYWRVILCGSINTKFETQKLINRVIEQISVCICGVRLGCAWRRDYKEFEETFEDNGYARYLYGSDGFITTINIVYIFQILPNCMVQLCAFYCISVVSQSVKNENN